MRFLHSPVVLLLHCALEAVCCIGCFKCVVCMYMYYMMNCVNWILLLEELVLDIGCSYQLSEWLNS